MARDPRILASFLHGTLQAVDARDAELGCRVRAALKPDVLEEIEDAWGGAWLPIGYDVALTEAFFELAGEEQACRVMHDTLAQTFERPILRPIVDAALRVLGARTESLLRWAPRIWGLLFRDAGTLLAEASPGQASVRIHGLPPEVANSRPYLLGMAAALSAIFDLTREQGTCRLEASERQEARFELRWGAAE